MAVAPRVNEKDAQSRALDVEQLKPNALLVNRVRDARKKVLDVYTHVLAYRQLDRCTKLTMTSKRLTASRHQNLIKCHSISMIY